MKTIASQHTQLKVNDIIIFCMPLRISSKKNYIPDQGCFLPCNLKFHMQIKE